MAVGAHIHTKHINALCGQNFRILYLNATVHKMTPDFERVSDLDLLNTRLLAEIKRYGLLAPQFLDGGRIAPRFDRYNPSRPGTHYVHVPEEAWTRGSEIFYVAENRNSVS